MKRMFLVFVCLSNLALAQIVEFCWKRVPNIQEILFDSGIEAPIDLLLGDFTKSLGHNPAAKSVLRDTMKLPSAIAKAEAGTEVGKTGYYFDRSQVYSQAAKTVLKIGGMLTLVTIFNVPKKQAAILANYPGDIVARYFVKAGQYRQKSNSTLTFEEYVLIESQPAWFLWTILEVTPKILVSNYMAGLVEKTHLGQNVRGGVMHFLNRFRPPHHRVNIDQTFYENIKGAPRALKPVIFLSMMAAFFAEKTALTYVLAPPARIAMDGIAAAQDYLSSFYYGPVKDEL